MVARKIYDLSIDLGNIDNKGVFVDPQGELILESFPNKVTSKKSLNPKAIKLNKDGETLYFGVGDSNDNSKKFERKYLEEQALVMIDKLLPVGEYDDYVVVDLRLGLPPEQYQSDMALENFKSKFTVGKEIEYRIDDKYRKVKINSLKVYMECHSAFKAVEAQGLIGTSTKKILVMDIGGGTMDIIDYTFDPEDNCFYPNTPLTIEKGILDMTKSIAEAINNNNINTVTPESVEYSIRNGFELVDETYRISDYEYAISHIKNDIITKINNEFGIQSFELVQVMGLGAGFDNFNKLTNNSIDNHIKLPSQLKRFGNAIGFLCQ